MTLLPCAAPFRSENGDGCSAACQIEATARCGDGIADPGEECDLGVLNSDSAPGTCIGSRD